MTRPVPGDDELGAIRAAARHRLGDLLATALRNEPRQVVGQDAEVLHDFRVAHRRARVLLKEYGKAFGKSSRRLAAEMRRLARRTGPMRDLDLLAERVGTADATRPGSGRDLLLGTIRERREAAERALYAHIASARYVDLVASWKALVLDPGDAADAARSDAFERWTLERIQARFERLSAASGGFDERTDDDAIHAMRIQAKRLRYLLEFLVAHRPERRAAAGPIVDRLKRLQDRLGAYQDLRAHAALLRTVADDPMAPLQARVEAVRRAAGLDARRLRSRRGVALALRRFTGPGMRRRLRALLRLAS